jgi:hypothetical protein
MNTKQQTLLNGIVFGTLPGVKDNTLMQCAILELIKLYPTSISIENLVEHSLAIKGGYNFVDEACRDFDDIDNSDSKTVTVNAKTGRAEIIGLETKVGAIRITVYNPVSTEGISFLYIPADYRPLLVRDCYGQSSGKKRLMITWSQKRPQKYKDNKVGYFNMYEKFRVDTFDELASMTDKRFYELNPQLRLSTSLPVHGSDCLPKNDPSEQKSSPCTERADLPQSQDSSETLPTSLSA